MLLLLGTPQEKIDTMKQLYTIKNSKLHGKGLFAKYNIKAGTNIVEYVGEKNKAQSDRIAEIQLKKAQKIEKKGKFIFLLLIINTIIRNVSYNKSQINEPFL